MLLYRIARRFRSTPTPLLYENRWRLVHRQPPSIILCVPARKYSTDYSTPDSEPDSLTTRITNLEKTYGSIIEDGFKELKNDLKSELKHELMTMEKSMDRSFATCNNRINDLSSWNQWIIGTICTGVMFKVVFYDRYTEEKLMAKILDSETRITTMVQNALIQLKLELRINQ